jgi:hypothetical protein
VSVPTEAQRVVIVDPGHSGPSGHHAELNAQLLAAGRAAGLAIECWVDQEFQGNDPAYLPVLRDCGYVDPRHWLDLPGSLHLANRLEAQLQAELDASAAGPVTCWITHSLLPFQLIGLAKLLQHQPAARVEVGILYGPGERLGGSTDPAAVSPGPERERDLAIANARLAWSGLAQAAASAGHQLRIGCSSHLQAALHEPLLRAAGLPAASLQPAVVGAGWQPGSALSARGCALPNDDAPLVLLHWGDLKAEKGRQQVMALVNTLLKEHAQTGSRSAPGEAPARRWLFHHCSVTALPPNEQQLLVRAEQELPGFQLWQGPISTETMQQLLARTAVALLPYCPQAYGERSSGVLWCYAAARLACGQPARAVGYTSGWLAVEAQALGMSWQGVSANVAHQPQAWLAAIDAALRAPPTPFSLYGQQVLGQSYAQWLLAALNSDC